ncbi:MAG: KH domain-containing protein [bacterium]
MPESAKGRIIGKSGANISALEKTMGLNINLKSFDDLPLLDVPTEVTPPQKHGILEIIFPVEYANQNICFLIGDEVAYFTSDTRGIVAIKSKELSKLLMKKGFVLVDMSKL